MCYTSAHIIHSAGTPSPSVTHETLLFIIEIQLKCHVSQDKMVFRQALSLNDRSISRLSNQINTSWPTFLYIKETYTQCRRKTSEHNACIQVKKYSIKFLLQLNSHVYLGSTTLDIDKLWSKKFESHCPKTILTHVQEEAFTEMFTVALCIKWKTGIQMSISRRLDKQNMVCSYNGTLDRS